MRFTVTWRRGAENELARIWNQAADRDAVTQASDQIDRLLRNSSTARGNDQAGIFQLTVWPLRVVFAVSPDDCLVTVARVFDLG
jgi:plasmid stabilization system protein ParE